MKIKKFDIKKFEKLTNDSPILKGGFSIVIGGNLPNQDLGDPITNSCTNNCAGGNCVAGCGVKK